MSLFIATAPVIDGRPGHELTVTLLADDTLGSGTVELSIELDGKAQRIVLAADDPGAVHHALQQALAAVAEHRAPDIERLECSVRLATHRVRATGAMAVDDSDPSAGWLSPTAAGDRAVRQLQRLLALLASERGRP